MVKSRFNLLKVIIAVCVLSLALSLGGLFAGKNQKTVSADAPAANGISMFAGVSVKLNSNGLRYRMLIGDDLWASVKDDDSLELGMLVFPTQYLDDFAIDNDYHKKLDEGYKVDIELVKDKVYRVRYSASEIYYCANGVLSNIKSKAFNASDAEHIDIEFTAVGYIYDKTE